MGRGYMYEIEEQIHHIGAMDESDFYEEIPALHIDYVQNMSLENQELIRDSFSFTLQSHGASVKSVTPDASDKDLFPHGVYAISNLSEAFKRNFFAERFNTMKKLAAEITLDQFASNASNDIARYLLEKAITDEYGDMVYYQGTYYTVDYFIRNADPTKTYYLGNVVFLH